MTAETTPFEVLKNEAINSVREQCNSKKQIFDFTDVDVWMYHFNSDAFNINNRPDVQSGSIVGATNITKVASVKSLKIFTPSSGECIFTLNLDTPFDYVAGNNLVIYLEKRNEFTNGDVIS